ncbi:hypothetical protein LCGC14_0561310 [marine sediment metagenome]|uniref:DUF3168 domain-containing protein n=1 Tax=marine sediment metagenome TaxID=412755 RepID=A0A0F9RS22_9ZZZZ
MAGRTLYNTEGDDEAVFPYATVSIVGGVADWTFTEDFEDVLIQFNLFSETPACTEVGAAFTALKVAFDKHDLTIVGYETVSFERGNANLIRVDKKWQYIVTYMINIQKD